MAMPRRKPLVYGKVKRSASGYDFFGLDDWSQGGGERQSIHDTSYDQSRLGGSQRSYNWDQAVAKSVESTSEKQCSAVRPRAVPKRKPTPTTCAARKESGTKDGTGKLASGLESPPPDSNEGRILFQKSMQKRRRLTPVRKDDKNCKTKTNSRELNSSSANDHEKQSDHSRVFGTGSSGLHDRKMGTDPSPATQRKNRRMTTPPQGKSEFCHEAPPCTTPRQPKLLSSLPDSPSARDSPRKLPLISLSLRIGEDTNPGVSGSSSECLVQREKARGSVLKSKRRLIDAMVSPRKRLSVSTSSELTEGDSASDVPGSPLEREDFMTEHRSGPEASPEASTEASAEGAATGEENGENVVLNHSFTSLSTASQSKITYSRERSHLADMLTEELLDPVNQTSSQGDGLLLALDDGLASSFDNHISQQEADGDADQGVASIRSIHELRRAGGKARSQVDIESIFEDVEAKGHLARARRLRGLAVLTERLAEAEVGQHIREQCQEQRLSQCPLLDGDFVGQTLLAMCLSHLMIGVQLPKKSLSDILWALVPAGRSLLEEGGDLMRTVRDGKQKLAKGTCMKITTAVESFCSSAGWTDQRPEFLSPRLAFIKFLDIVIRQGRLLGDFGMSVPPTIFQSLVHLLVHIDPIHVGEGSDMVSRLSTAMVISVLESLTISGNWAEDHGCVEAARGLSRLGPLLAELTASAGSGSKHTYLLLLRLILNITNNDSGLCDAFADPGLISSIFGIVQRDFLQTAMLANGGLKEAKLEGVILALGALSNLAEHSHLCRQRMSDRSTSVRSMVDWIAVTFRDQAEIASKASSVEETSSLVAFGYLSVLLCTLCVDKQIRFGVRRMLRGGSLQSLLVFVQEFLNHFRKAEQLETRPGDDQDKMQSGFVDRFEGVLDALAHAEAES